MRRHLSYANVVATLALVFAMSGGAMAANSYLINSTKQINPKVLKKLTGKKGRAGVAGSAGAIGAIGPAGPQGLTGKEGSTGKEGPFPKGDAPSGITIRGDYGVFGATGGINGYTGISFGYTLSAGPTINYIPAGEPVPAACAGGSVEMPQAQPGNLCIFEAFHSGFTPEAFDPATDSTTTAGRTGAIVYNEPDGATPSDAEGTWAVTSP
jgi:hypothetical protein